MPETRVKRTYVRSGKYARKTPPPIVPDSVPDDQEVATPELEVEVNIPYEEKEPSTLKEKLFGFFKNTDASQPEKPKRRSSKKDENNAIVTMVPTILAGLVCANAQTWFPPEYKACAPQYNEVVAIFKPLMSIVGRRVSVVSKASQDTIDIIQAMLALTMLGTRSYITYVEIRNARIATETRNDSRSGAHPMYGMYGEKSEQTTGTATSGTASTGSTEPGTYEAGYGTGSDVNNGNDGARTSTARSGHPETSPMFDLLMADRAGRSKLGIN